MRGTWTLESDLNLLSSKRDYLPEGESFGWRTINGLSCAGDEEVAERTVCSDGDVLMVAFSS